jgi:hypoxanthine phosphoribosyltransferase
MEISPQEAARVYAEAECLFDRGTVEAAIDRLAEETARTLSGSNPLVLGVMTGGVVLLGGLLTRWSFPLQVDYLHATRYRGALSGGDRMHWLAEPRTPLAGRSVVIVDDVLDGGITLVEIMDWCRARGAAELMSIVLVHKDNPARDPSIRADHVGIRAPNRYLFGYGMDYHEYLRNAPGVFAVRGL